MTIYTGIYPLNWWFSIAMLNYQRVGETGNFFKVIAAPKAQNASFQIRGFVAGDAVTVIDVLSWNPQWSMVSEICSILMYPRFWYPLIFEACTFITIIEI